MGIRCRARSSRIYQESPGVRGPGYPIWIFYSILGKSRVLYTHPAMHRMGRNPNETDVPKTMRLKRLQQKAPRERATVRAHPNHSPRLPNPNSTKHRRLSRMEYPIPRRDEPAIWKGGINGRYTNRRLPPSPLQQIRLTTMLRTQRPDRPIRNLLRRLLRLHRRKEGGINDFQTICLETIPSPILAMDNGSRPYHRRNNRLILYRTRHSRQLGALCKSPIRHGTPVNPNNRSINHNMGPTGDRQMSRDEIIIFRTGLILGITIGILFGFGAAFFLLIQNGV